MRVVCERCATPFNVDDSRIPAAGAKATCTRCGNLIIVRRPKPPPDPLAVEGGSGTGASVPSLARSALRHAMPAVGLPRDAFGGEVTPAPGDLVAGAPGPAPTPIPDPLASAFPPGPFAGPATSRTTMSFTLEAEAPAAEALPDGQPPGEAVPAEAPAGETWEEAGAAFPPPPSNPPSMATPAEVPPDTGGPTDLPPGFTTAAGFAPPGLAPGDTFAPGGFETGAAFGQGPFQTGLGFARPGFETATGFAPAGFQPGTEQVPPGFQTGADFGQAGAFQTGADFGQAGPFQTGADFSQAGYQTGAFMPAGFDTGAAYAPQGFTPGVLPTLDLSGFGAEGTPSQAPAGAPASQPPYSPEGGGPMQAFAPQDLGSGSEAAWPPPSGIPPLTGSGAQTLESSAQSLPTMQAPLAFTGDDLFDLPPMPAGAEMPALRPTVVGGPGLPATVVARQPPAQLPTVVSRQAPSIPEFPPTAVAGEPMSLPPEFPPTVVRAEPFSAPPEFPPTVVRAEPVSVPPELPPTFVHALPDSVPLIQPIEELPSRPSGIQGLPEATPPIVGTVTSEHPSEPGPETPTPMVTGEPTGDSGERPEVTAEVTGELISGTGPPSSPYVTGEPITTSQQWRVRKTDGRVEGPFSAREMVARHEAGLISPGDAVSMGGDNFRNLGEYPLTAAFLQRTKGRKVKAFASTERAPIPWQAAVAVLVATVLVVGAIAVVATRPGFLFPAKKVDPVDVGARSIIDRWRETEPAPLAGPEELYQLGRGYYAADTRDGWRRAAEAYKRVLIRAPDNLKAMAGYAEVRALLAIEDGDGVGLSEANALLGYALRHGNKLPQPHLARANILASTGTAAELLTAQQEAQQARTLAPDDPEVQLALARTFVGSNTEFALECVEKAAAKSPDLRRVPLMLGDVYLRMGRLADARRAFEKRRRLVPDDPQADLRLAELDASTGRFERAHSRLDAATKANPRSMDVKLFAAVLAYQVNGDFQGAHEALEALLSVKADRRRRVKVAVHAAAVAQHMGDAARAEAVARAALEIDPESAPLHFRMALLHLAAGRTAEAREALDKAADRMPDRAQRAIVSGRIHAATGQIDEARNEFGRAMSLSPQRAEPYLLAAAMYAQVGAAGQALTLARRALQADPAWLRTHRAPTEYWEGQAYMKLAVGGFEMMAMAQDEIPLVQGAVSMARYHSGDVPGAEHAARRAIASGQAALAARVYLAQLDLDRMKPRDALQELAAAADIDPRCALVQYLTGQALAQLGRYEDARPRYRRALELDAAFTPARVRGAEALAESGQRKEALEELNRAYKEDSESLDVRRARATLEEAEGEGRDGPLGVESEPDGEAAPAGAPDAGVR